MKFLVFQGAGMLLGLMLALFISSGRLWMVRASSQNVLVAWVGSDGDHYQRWSWDGKRCEWMAGAVVTGVGGRKLRLDEYLSADSFILPSHGFMEISAFRASSLTF